MKKLLIIKTGETFPVIKERFGDFEEMIRIAADLRSEEVTVAPVYKGIGVLPTLENIGAIVITGSHSMVTNQEEWSESLKAWLKQIAHLQIPTLGICYGHQLLAEAFGGKVDYHPKGIEIGTASIQLTEAAREDALFGCIPPTYCSPVNQGNQHTSIKATIFGHVTHSQTVIRLPEQAVLLASNEFEPHHAFKLKKHMYGVQFHPEFTADIIRVYIDEQREYLEKSGYSIENVCQSVIENDYGTQILQLFVWLAGLKKDYPIQSTEGWTIFEAENEVL